MLYASRYNDVPIVVNISGRFDLKSGLTKRLGENCYQIINENGYLDVKDDAGKLSIKFVRRCI